MSLEFLSTSIIVGIYLIVISPAFGQESNISEIFPRKSSEDLIGNMVDYQGPDLGLTFKYPASWPNPTYPDYQNCFKNSDSCNVSFPLVNQDNNMDKNFVVGIGVNKFFTKSDSQQLLIPEKTCFCTTLHDYIKWDYDRLYKEKEFLQDGQTSLGNQSSWQMDVLDKGNGYKTLVTWAINDNFGYRFIYSGPADNHFDYFLDEYKSLLDSVKFTGIENKGSTPLTGSTVPKKPSFLSNDTMMDSPPSSTSLNETLSNATAPNGTSSTTNASTSIIKSDSTENSESNFTGAQVSEAFRTYQNPGFGLTLEYPSTWDVEELRTDPSELGDNSIVAIFKSQSQGLNDKYLENVIINVQGPSSDIKSLESYTRNSIQEFNDMSDINIIKSGKATLAGFPAHQINYTSGESLGLNLKKMQIFTVLDNVAYLVTYGAEEAEYDKNIADVENLINSIKIDSGSTSDESGEQKNTAYSQQGTNEENDLVFEVQGLRTSPVVQKLEISGEVWEKVCPSNQCQVEEYEYSSYVVLPEPEDTDPRLYTSVYIYIHDDVTNKDLTPLQKNFAERYDLSFSCDVNSVNDIIEQGDNIIYKCSSDLTSLSKENPEENDPTYYFNVEGTYDTRNDTLTGTGEYDSQYP